jgi:hypothetical protein
MALKFSSNSAYKTRMIVPGWKYPGPRRVRTSWSAWLKCTKRDLKIEDGVCGHTPASVSEPTAPKFIEVLTVDREWIPTAKDEMRERAELHTSNS